MPRAKGVWSTGAPTLSVDAAGMLHASIPIKDTGVVAVTIAFTLTEDHALRVVVTSAAGNNGLSAFEAWSSR